MISKDRFLPFWVLGLFLLMTGCRHTEMQDNPDWPNPGPVDVASLPPIQNVINHGTADPDQILSQTDSLRAEARLNSVTNNQGRESLRTQANPIYLGTIRDNTKAGSILVEEGEKLSESGNSPPPISTQGDQLRQMGTPDADAPNQTDDRAVALASSTATAENSSLPDPSNLSVAENAVIKSNQFPVSDAQTPPALSTEPQQQPVHSNILTEPNGSSGEPQIASASSSKATEVLGLGFDGLPPTAVSAGRVVAHVGREIITVYDLNVAIQDWIKANVPQGQIIPEKDRLLVARMVLSQMMDRMLITQEANRMMKSEKQKEALFSQIDRVWEENRLPELRTMNKVDTNYELDQVMKKQGKSLEKVKQEFVNDALAHEFMGMKLGGKTFVSLVEMRKYYNENLKEFDRPAQYTWREIRIAIKPGKQTEAEAEAKTILNELKQHSDFATLAKRKSQGPTADQGGLWETSPGGFIVAQINETLDKLTPGQMAGPIQSDTAIHFLKMESKREAGPARFDEIQGVIQEKIRNEKLAKASTEYILELRKQTVIDTIFDQVDLKVGSAQPSQDSSVRQVNGSKPVAATPQSNPLNSPAGGHSDVLSQNPQSGLQTIHRNEKQFSEPPPALAPAGPLPPRGVMSGPSQPSPL